MKVTTQQTSKPIKLIIAIGVVLAVVGSFGVGVAQSWGWPCIGLGLVLFLFGRVLKWWQHE